MSAMAIAGMAACSDDGSNSGFSAADDSAPAYGVSASTASRKAIYGLDGCHRDSLRHGINILNGKKIIIK